MVVGIVGAATAAGIMEAQTAVDDPLKFATGSEAAAARRLASTGRAVEAVTGAAAAAVAVA